MKRYVAVLLIALMLLTSACAPADPMYTPNENATLITVDPGADNNEAPEEETPAPEEETPAPEEETPAPEEETPAPEEETPAPEEEEPEYEDSPDWTTSCMTFNVLQIKNPGTDYDTPEVRAPWILDTIVRYDPDLLGLQEVTHDNGSNLTWDMHDYLIDNLTNKNGYDVIGMMDAKDKPGSKIAVKDYTIGSGLLIMWKKDRFELKDYGSMVYSNDSGRHYQWAKLYDSKEDITILMTNTHMSINTKTGIAEQDKANGNALRAQQAAELFTFWNKNCGEDMALYATGDYNHQTSAQAFSNMTQGKFVSTRDISQKSNADSGIDHVLINGDIQDCYEYHRCDETYQGGVPKVHPTRDQAFAPSDHHAVIAYCSNAYRA